ncbi:MAG: 2-oxoacid:acceptor oxidoreductase family protein [Candidatus Heimdallarchaeota archaeon]
MTMQIRLAGIGGQGIKYAGRILGKAATESGFAASQIVRYTPATRGGLIYSDLVISEETNLIINPFIERPNLFCAMARAAWDAFADEIPEFCHVIVDKNIVGEVSPRGDPFESIDFAAASPHPAMTNMVLLGFLCHNLEIGHESFEEALRTHGFRARVRHGRELLRMEPEAFERAFSGLVSKRFLKDNLEAFRRGHELWAKIHPLNSHT